MSRYFNLQLKDEIRPIVIIAETQNEAFKQAAKESNQRNTHIISLIEVHKVDARRGKR